MQSSPASGDNPSTKTALDHLQLLVEKLLRENRHLKLSLQHTRSQLDEVRSNLNQFKLQVAEHDRQDCLMRKQIRTMATLIERHRHGATNSNSPPSSPEVRPTPPPSSVSKSPPSPSRPPHANLPTDIPNISEFASVSQIPTARDAPTLSDVNGNCSTAPSPNQSDAGSRMDSLALCAQNPQPSDSSSPSNTRGIISTSRSPPEENPAEKVSSPSTSVSDALQKAFVAMEKDTTNNVQVLHDTKHAVSVKNVTDANHRVEKVSRCSVVQDKSRDANAHEARKVKGDDLQHRLNKQPGSSLQRSLKALKKKVAGTSPASDNDVYISSKRPTNRANGRLQRSLTMANQSSKSPSHSANHLARNVAVKKTKKGYKVSLALSRKSSKSGDSSSSSSSDSSGPGCSASLSQRLGRPPKAQVSLEAGFSELIGAARKLKDNLHRKEGDGKHDRDSQDGSESEEMVSESNSNLVNGSLQPSTAIAFNAATLYAVGHYEEPIPNATGSPKLGESIREQNNRLDRAVMMSHDHMNDRTTWQHTGQSGPFTYGSASHLKNVQYMQGIPHNRVPESVGILTSLGPEHFVGHRMNGVLPITLENHSRGAALTSRGLTQESDHQSLAAGKATESDVVDSSAVAENPIREITHVPVRPRSFAVDEKRRNAALPSTVQPPPGDTTEFLAICSRSSEMLPWKARPGSKYVDVSKCALAVKHPAAVSLEDGKVIMNGKMRILKSIGMTDNDMKYCYMSPMYPDGTFLPYVPVSGVVLHGKPVHWDSSRYAEQSVQLSFSKEVFDTLVSYARRAYRKRHPGAQMSFPGAFLAGHRVRKVVRIEPECSVNMTRLHRAPSKCSVAETLAFVKKDVVGLVLLYITIEAKTEDGLSAEVIFGLHSMVAHRLFANG